MLLTADCDSVLNLVDDFSFLCFFFLFFSCAAGYIVEVVYFFSEQPQFLINFKINFIVLKALYIIYTAYTSI